jgi:hypothetical protein
MMMALFEQEDLDPVGGNGAGGSIAFPPCFADFVEGIGHHPIGSFNRRRNRNGFRNGR